MSHSTFAKQWGEAQLAIDDMLQLEQPVEPPKPEKDKLAAFQLLATMYIKYIQIFRRLEQSYDQMVHPQKRRVLRHCLDGVMGRVLEIKNEMINLEYSEFHYMDDVLSDLKLTPSDIEMPIPKYFTLSRLEAIKKRAATLEQILARVGPQDQVDVIQESRMTVQEAMLILQTMERARQGRLRAKFMREIRQQEEREKLAKQRGAPSIDPEVAAVTIQKHWKGFSMRRRAVKEREEEMMFIGMIPPPPPNDYKKTPMYQASKVEELRRITQDLHEQEFGHALVTVRDKIHESEGPDMKENMQEQIRQWFIECRDASGKFPDYPDEDEGGSSLIFKQKSPEELEAELAGKADKKEKGKKSGKKSGKKDKKEKKGKKGKGKKGKGDDDDEEEGWKMAPSNFVSTVVEGTESYKSVWVERNETENFSQKHDVELIKEEKRAEVEEEVRQQVDELMREELKNLQMAVERDKKGKKGKKSGKKKKKKGKKSGKKKGKKGKKEKDLTPERTMESLFEELVEQGIIKKVLEVRLADYEGEYSYLGTTLRQANIEPMPSLSDVRRLVTESAILPMGSAAVHEKAPLVKSILLAGPRGTGKKMLVNAIAYETGATLFNLTAANIAGKYPGKDGLKMMMHMVFKVGRAYQPSVIHIDNCELMFKKKVPKTDPTDPKRLKKELPKAIKAYFKGEERLLLVGTTRAPFEGEMKPMIGCYQRVILIPRPDYSSRHLLWRTQIVKHQGILTGALDVSSLAKVTEGYTPGHIVEACQAVLKERRVADLQKKALVGAEFIGPLAKIDPIYKDEEEAYRSWYQKTPLGKKRAKAAAGDEDDGGGGKGKKGGGKKKGKKKK